MLSTKSPPSAPVKSQTWLRDGVSESIVITTAANEPVRHAVRLLLLLRCRLRNACGWPLAEVVAWSAGGRCGNRGRQLPIEPLTEVLHHRVGVPEEDNLRETMLTWNPGEPGVRTSAFMCLIGVLLIRIYEAVSDPRTLVRPVPALT
jgi:hypothetical protein